MAKKDENKEFPELEKKDTKGEGANKLEFRRIIAVYKAERPESYEASKDEYERILVKLGNHPDMHFNDVGFTSYENNKVLG